MKLFGILLTYIFCLIVSCLSDDPLSDPKLELLHCLELINSNIGLIRSRMDANLGSLLIPRLLIDNFVNNLGPVIKDLNVVLNYATSMNPSSL